MPERLWVWRPLLLSALGGLGLGVLMLIVAPLMPVQTAVVQLKASPTLFRPALALLGLGPLLEEMLFRGLLGSLLLRYFTFGPAAIINGLVFALAHGFGWLLLPFSLAGISLFWLYYRYRVVFYPWLAHLIWNTMVFFAHWQ